MHYIITEKCNVITVMSSVNWDGSAGLCLLMLSHIRVMSSSQCCEVCHGPQATPPHYILNRLD